MAFYDEHLVPIIEKTCTVIEKTPHMQDILRGSIPLERFRFQIRHNYQYLIEYARCWAIGFAKCTNFEDLEAWYKIQASTMDTVVMNREFWAQQLEITMQELDATIMAPGKRSYTSHELARAWEGDLAACLMALFPCNILYRFFGEHMLPQCKLDKENMHYKWFEFYVLPPYVEKCNNEIAMVNRLCAEVSEARRKELLEIFAISCNYEILQWQDMYYKMETWPLLEIFPQSNI